MQSSFWKDKRVFLTGHTGFKGGWLAHWLCLMGARVYGYGLEPPTTPSFFHETRLAERLASSYVGDIRNLEGLSAALTTAEPDIVMHMAAQPLVRESYKAPLETLTTNVIGTANVLEAVRGVTSVKAVVSVTTDKCYANQEWAWPYRETDQLGGHDPYSASKACAELVSAAYRDSFLTAKGAHLATVRAGNVIGGGDWAVDRLVPDFLRSLDEGEALRVRYPTAVRPWQHVLEPLAGYLSVAEELFLRGPQSAGAWNFGPAEEDAKSVGWIADTLCSLVTVGSWEAHGAPQLHEAGRLKLDSSKARAELGWRQRWTVRVLSKTVDWHQAWNAGHDVAQFTSDQIAEYQAA